MSAIPSRSPCALRADTSPTGLCLCLAHAVNTWLPASLRRMGFRRDVVEEAVGEAQVKAMAAIRHGEPWLVDCPRRVRWLVRVARNAALASVRKKAAAPLPAEEYLPPKEDSDITDVLAVRAAMAVLESPLREAVRLRYFDGMTYREAAEAMGVSDGTFTRLLTEALERLTTILR